jgi:hypothetical protein
MPKMLLENRRHPVVVAVLASPAAALGAFGHFGEKD